MRKINFLCEKVRVILADRLVCRQFFHIGMAKIEFLWEKIIHMVINMRFCRKIFPIEISKSKFLWEICIAKQIPQGFRGATPRRRGTDWHSLSVRIMSDNPKTTLSARFLTDFR